MRTQAAPTTLPHPADAPGQGAPAAPVPPARPRQLLEAADVAELLGVRATFVYALARRGALPTVRLGERYVRFRPEAVSAWIKECESTRPKGTR
jgi:excisionase family DNA binding protein